MMDGCMDGSKAETVCEKVQLGGDLQIFGNSDRLSLSSAEPVVKRGQQRIHLMLKLNSCSVSKIILLV